MSLLNLLKLIFHGGVFILILTLLYLTIIVTSFLFVNTTFSILYLLLSVLLFIPLINGIINQVISKIMWEGIKMKKPIIKIWFTGFLLLIIYFGMTTLLVNLGIPNSIVTILSFILLSFPYGVLGYKLSQSSFNKIKDGGV